jgi:colicin import membrane protein
VKVKVDKTVLASVALHVVVLGGVLLSFSTKAFVMVPEETVSVDVSFESQSKSGSKTGKKENQNKIVEKVSEKPVDDAVGKISEKPPVVTETAPPPTPKVDSVAEETAKAEAEARAKAEAAAQAKAEAKAKAEADAAAKAEAKAKAEADAAARAEAKAKAEADAKARAEAKAKAEAAARARAEAKARAEAEAKAKSENTMASIAELLNKKDPTRAAKTGAELNANDALGTSKGRAADNSATWGAMFRQQVERCWKKPYGGVEQQMAEAVFSIRLKRDGTLEGMPVALGTPKTPYLRVYQESGLRAIIGCQPYKLPPAFYDEWQFFEPGFTEKNQS